MQTSNGFILGGPPQNAEGVMMYLGIVYAQPPVGDLKFAAPKELEVGDTRGVFTASDYVCDVLLYPLGFCC